MAKNGRFYFLKLVAFLLVSCVLGCLVACSDGIGSDDYIADNSGDHYYGINGGAASTGIMTPATGGGTTGGVTTSAPRLIMKTGREIKAALIALGANNFSSSYSFSSASSSMTSGLTQELSAPNSATRVVAWRVGTNMFYYAEGYTDCGRKIPLNEDSSLMFADCKTLGSIDLSGFDTSNVKNMSKMFAGCHSLSSIDFTDFDTSNVEDMSEMFYGCSALIPDVSNFDTRKVKNMHFMFYHCAGSSFDVSNFDTREVTDMFGMFSRCNHLQTIDLSNFNTRKVTDMKNMFADCEHLSTIYVSADFVVGGSSTGMFRDCSSLEGGQLTRWRSAHVDGDYAHIDGGTSNPGYFTAKP